MSRRPELTQMPILISAELNSKEEKCSFLLNCLQNALLLFMHLLGSVQMYMKSSASKSKPLQSRSTVKILSRARHEERPRFTKNRSENFNHKRTNLKGPNLTITFRKWSQTVIAKNKIDFKKVIMMKIT